MMRFKMKITEIQQKYPNAKYYKLKRAPGKTMLVIERIEDFFNLSDTIGYFELEVDETEASDTLLESLIETYLHSKGSWVDLRNPVLMQWINYVKDNLSDELKSLIKVKSYTLTDLFAIDLGIMYEDSNDSLFISDEKFTQGLFEIDKIFSRRKDELNKIEEEHNREIINFILQFKDKYLGKQTKREKDELIQMIQAELKIKFNLDARGDYRASKVYIKNLYDEE